MYSDKFAQLALWSIKDAWKTNNETTYIIIDRLQWYLHNELYVVVYE